MDFLDFKKIPAYERELILAHLLEKSREYVLTHPEIILSWSQKSRYEKFLRRRLKKEPLAYILGHKEFYGFDFTVNKNTLIPRPETELLVELALEKIEKITRQPFQTDILDIGTGSGNIIIAIAKKMKKKNNAKLFAIDISSSALSVAKKNARTHGAQNKIKFLKGNLLLPWLKYNLLDRNLVVLANLPYLSKNNYVSAMEDVKKFEPRFALLSGKDGLSHYKRLFQQIKKARFKTLVVFLEISPEQKNKLSTLVKHYLPQAKLELKKDLAGKWRIAEILIK